MFLNPYRFGSTSGPPDAADVIAMFAGSITGGLYDCTDPANLWSDAARTTPASLNGTVRGITDLSGNGLHLSNTVTTFTRKNDGTRDYLDCPGTSFLQAFTAPNATLGSASGNLIAACYRATDYNNGMTVFAADKTLAYASGGIAIKDGTDAGSLGTNVRLNAGLQSISETGAKTPGIDVIAAVRALANSGGIIRRDGVQTASISVTGGVSASNANSPLTLGAGFLNANNNYFNPFKGRVYCAMFISRPLSDSEIEMVEAYFASRAQL